MCQRVFIVEDDRFALAALTQILRCRDCHVNAAISLKAALNYLEKCQVMDCILLDLMLPDGDGSDVLHYIRGNDIRVPVAVMTGCLPGYSAYDAAMALRPDMVLPKPVNLRLLNRFIGRAGSVEDEMTAAELLTQSSASALCRPGGFLVE